MTLEPLLTAPVAIQFHVATVLPAAVLGAFLLARPKGTPAHRFLGKVWLLLMVISAASTFFIRTIDLFMGFSPIHLLSVYVIVGSGAAIATARRGDITAHRRQVAGMYFGGIVVAGIFTLLPDRLVNAVVFSDAGSLGSGLAAGVLCLAFVSAGALAARQSGLFARSGGTEKRSGEVPGSW